MARGRTNNVHDTKLARLVSRVLARPSLPAEMILTVRIPDLAPQPKKSVDFCVLREEKVPGNFSGPTRLSMSKESS